MWITAVPLYKSRECKRGYNQAELLAKELSKKLNIQFVANVLMREKQTKLQFELKKEERKKNVLDAFCLNSKFNNKLSGVKIILVDDITTTGSTLQECEKILKKSGVEKVLGVTLAHEG